MSVVELKERHAAATQTVNALRERLKQKRQLLLDTDGYVSFSFFFFFFSLKFLKRCLVVDLGFCLRY